MRLLRGTTDLLKVITGSAGDIRPAVDVVYANNSAPPVIQAWPDFQALASILTATTTTLVDASGLTSGYVYNVKGLTLYNAHATISNLITVEITDGSNTSIVWNGTLLSGEMVVYDEVGTWTLYGVDGVPKPAAAKLDVKLYVAADVVNATTSFADITGLTYAVSGGKKYGFEAVLHHINNATTTGSQFGVNIGATPTVLIVSTIDTVTASVTASVHSAGSVTAVDTAITAQTTGSAAVTMALIAGFIQPSADGTFAMRLKSEVAVAAGITVKAGSWVRIFEMT